MTAIRTSALVLVSLILVGCSPGGSSTSGPPGASGAVGSITVTAVQDQTYGPVLTGPSGRSLYVRLGAGGSPQTCTGDCLTAWPALTVAAGASVLGGAHVPPGTLSTVVRADDGSIQVTYMGLPLYYFTGDTKPGDVTGYGINGFLVATVPAFEPIPTACPTCIPRPAPSPSG